MENTFSDLLRDLRERRGYTVNQLAIKSGVSAAHISRLENELRSAPKSMTIKKLASVLGNYNELMEAAGHVAEHNAFDLLDALEDNNTQLTAGGQALTPDQRLAIARVLDNPSVLNIAPKPTVPLLGSIRAGVPLMSEQNIIGEVDITADLVSKADFALQVKGDSMVGAGISEGDIVICKQAEVAAHGQIVVALVNADETTLKFYIKENGKAVLRAANPRYEDIDIKPGDEIQGYVVMVRKEPPTINTYKEFLYYQNELQDWNEVLEAAITGGIKPDFAKQLIETQISLAKQLAKRKSP